MKQVMWVLVFGIAAGLAYWLWYALRRYEEKKHAEEARHAAFMAQMVSAAVAKPPEDAVALAQQKLLFEAATKAGEAGETALAIQLHARLVARYPASAPAEQAKEAVEALKKKLAKG